LGIGIFGAAAAFYALFIARTSFVFQGDRYFTLIDDAMISMRYARNLAAGDGLVWNPGQEAVEGYTNFLWVLVMTIPHLLGLDNSITSLFVEIVSLALLLATGLVAWKIAARLVPDSALAPPIAAALVLFYYPLAFWTLRGMETGASAFLITVSVLLAFRVQEEFRSATLVTLAFVLGLSLLIRTDAAVVAVPVAVLTSLAVERPYRLRALLVLLGVILVVLAGHTLFRLSYYGEAFPNTYYLKVEGISLLTRLERGGLAVLDTSRVHLHAPLILVGVYWLLARARWTIRSYLLVAPFLASAAYSVYVGGDAWEGWRYANRYLAQAIPPLLVITVVAIEDMIRAGREVRLRWIKLVAGSFVVVLLANLYLRPIDLLQADATGPGTFGLRILPILAVLLAMRLLWLSARSDAGVSTTASRLQFPIAGLAALVMLSMTLEPLGHWAESNAHHLEDDVSWAIYGLAIEQSTRSDAVIAVQAAGQIPYFSQRSSIDLLGKNDRRIAHLEPANDDPFRPGHNKWDLAYSIGELKPDYVAQLFHFEIGLAEAEALLAYGYEVVAGDCIVRQQTESVDTPTLLELIAETPGLNGRVCFEVLGAEEYSPVSSLPVGSDSGRP
jgi:hypothetical protein